MVTHSKFISSSAQNLSFSRAMLFHSQYSLKTQSWLTLKQAFCMHLYERWERKNFRSEAIAARMSFRPSISFWLLFTTPMYPNKQKKHHPCKLQQHTTVPMSTFQRSV